MKAPFIVLLLVAAAVAAANSPLFQILADDTSDVIFCKADGVKSCRKIRVNYDTVDEDRIHVGEYEYLKKHSIDKGDHMLYGYELATGSIDHHWDGVLMVYKGEDKVNGKFTSPDGDAISINNCGTPGCNVIIRT